MTPNMPNMIPYGRKASKGTPMVVVRLRSYQTCVPRACRCGKRNLNSLHGVEVAVAASAAQALVHMREDRHEPQSTSGLDERRKKNAQRHPWSEPWYSAQVYVSLYLPPRLQQRSNLLRSQTLCTHASLSHTPPGATFDSRSALHLVKDSGRRRDCSVSPCGSRQLLCQALSQIERKILR